MRIFLTGATGYVGRQIVRDLVKGGHSISALVRRGSEGRVPEELGGKITIIFGDLQHPEEYRAALQRCDAVINLPGLLREFPRKGITFEEVHFHGTRLLVDEAKRAGAARFLQMSALGVREGAKPKYQETKFRAEEYLKTSGVRWTIFRPSLMFGNEKEGMTNFMNVLRELLSMAPFVVPVLGDGKYRFQPVAVQNVAEGFVKALATESSVAKIYDVAGPERFTYNELLNMISYVTGKYKVKIHQPISVMKLLASMFGGFTMFPVSRDQITMLEEGNVSDHWRDFFDDFGILPLRMVENIHKGF